MEEKLNKLDLSQKYKEGLVKYEEGLDITLEWPELMRKGYTWEEHLKLNKLLEIEHMKYSLERGIEENQLTDEEVIEAQDIIQEAIKEYNEM